MLTGSRMLNSPKEMLVGQSQVTSAISHIESGTPESVILHVYSISDRLNRFSLMVGLGLYHTAVEVYGQEHSFIGHPFPFTGIVSIVPKTAGYIYHEGIEMGRTTMSEQSIGNHLRELGKVFTGHSYHLLHNNCNHFASEFVKRLCNGQPPAYINRAAHSACCLPFLDTMFSVKSESERLFVEVLYLTLNGDMTSVLDTLQVDHQTHLPRYVSYIEEAIGDHTIPACLPYSPVMKTYNPFTLSATILALVKKNLCTNFLFTQSKRIYDQAFDLYAVLKVRGLETMRLTDYAQLVMPEPTLGQDSSTTADYSTDIHRYLDHLQQRLLRFVRQTKQEEFSIDLNRSFVIAHVYRSCSTPSARDR